MEVDLSAWTVEPVGELVHRLIAEFCRGSLGTLG